MHVQSNQAIMICSISVKKDGAMIDREARDKTAELIRHLLSGVISFGDFGKALPIESPDHAVKSVIEVM